MKKLLLIGMILPLAGCLSAREEAFLGGAATAVVIHEILK